MNRGLLEVHSITALSWKEDRYQVEYTDRVSIEAWLGPLNVELRPIRHGLAHLMLPVAAREPKKALNWIESLLDRGRERQGSISSAPPLE